VLEHARRQAAPPVLVFSSSLAVFGADPALPPGERDSERDGAVGDGTLPRPQSSYGIQKFIGEQLVADYTRKGFARGRSVRLVTVAVRPGKPNAAASSFLSGIIREPLAGRRAVCPVPAQTEVALISPARAIDALLCAATSSDPAWGGRTAVTLPALTVRIADMVAALDRAAGPEATGLIDWVPDPAVITIMTGFPARIRADRARRLGLTPDPDFDSVIAMHLAEATRGRN
jgi:nucleoside-diphosphate-sugar epimerase